MLEKLSRHTSLDINKCAEIAGGRHHLILLATKRARFYQQQVNGYSAERAQLDAMFDIQNGLIGPDYQGGPVEMDIDRELKS